MINIIILLVALGLTYITSSLFYHKLFKEKKIPFSEEQLASRTTIFGGV